MNFPAADFCSCVVISVTAVPARATTVEAYTSYGKAFRQLGLDLRAEQVCSATDDADDQNARHHERNALRQLAPADQRLGNKVQQNADQDRADRDQNDVKQKPDQNRNEGETQNNRRPFEKFGRGHPWPR